MSCATSSNGTSQKQPTAPGDELDKANEASTNSSLDKGNTPKAPKPSSTMLPPPGGRLLKRNGKAEVERPSESRAQPKPVAAERKTKTPNMPGPDVDSEQEAMRQANVPSSFGAARDKPLGKRADREAHIVRGVPGAVISGASGRFATGRSRGSDKHGKAKPSAEEVVDKEEVRRQKEAEIAAITAELVQSDSGDAADKGDVEGGNGAGVGPSAQFKPGGWRHASGNGKAMMSMGSAGRKKSQRTGTATERSRREEEEDEEEEVEEEEEEEMTEEMRIKLVVRRLGLPVSHEVQLSGHRKGVTALALDRAGGRVATGANDYKVQGRLSGQQGESRRDLLFGRRRFERNEHKCGSF